MGGGGEEMFAIICDLISVKVHNFKTLFAIFSGSHVMTTSCLCVGFSDFCLFGI